MKNTDIFIGGIFLMKLSKKTWKNIFFSLICVLAIFLLFLW